MKDDIAVVPGLPEYIEKFSEAISKLHNVPFQLVAPFIDRTKSEVIKLGEQLGVEWQNVWCCYKGDSEHCGKCPGCEKRIAAFKAAGVQDRARYRT
jgi:7-cyano-7-deazaguanine synthase